MKIRTTTPNSSNKYYIQKSRGGWSPCIEGNDKHGLRPFPGSVLPNCVGAAVGRYNELIGKKCCAYLGNANAEDFIALAKKQGLEVGQKPRLGAIAVWSKGRPGYKADGAGHVAPVEKTNWTDSITVWQSGWGYTKATSNVSTYKKGSGNWGKAAPYRFMGFIYNPAVCPYPVPKITVQKGSRGSDAKFVQWCLLRAGCYPSNKISEVDGHFGSRSVKALEAFQKQHKLVPDGHAGPKTRAVMADLFSIV